MECNEPGPILTRRDALAVGATAVGAASLPDPLFAARLGFQ
jgi:hypothetical protein